MSAVDISKRGLTTLKYVDFPESVTELHCKYNQLTSLEHCPASVIELYCECNQLTSLEHCPKSITLDCSNNKLISLKYCPVTLLGFTCARNQLTSLEYCPNVAQLICLCNKLTSLLYCPASVTYIDCWNNPLYDEYKNLEIKEIHKLNKKKLFMQGLKIVQKMIQNSMAMRIQKKWRWWWYNDLDNDGISRFARFEVDKLNSVML